LLALAAFVAGIAWPGTGAAGDGDAPTAEPRKILWDTDPGGDDVFALLWLQSLAGQGLAEIVAVTTVAGNVPSEYTFINASKTLGLGRFGHVEVGRSAPAPRRGPGAAHIHGGDGMGNLSRTLPAATHRQSEARSADDIIIEKLGGAPGEITLVAVGPLTNLAAAEEKSPGILAKAKEVVVMGGAFRQRGNITPQAEFNIHCDPEAAQRVFASRDDIVVLPLDVTRQITFTQEHAAAVQRAAPEHEITRFVVALCRFMTKTTMSYRDTEGLPGFHVHDAATLAYLFYPETLLLRRAKVRIETQGRWTRGQTVFDERHGAKPEANAWVAMQVDAVNLLAILSEDLKTLCESE
jgi:inosine-uridine nucleoside N-ribohydrolase